MLPNSYYEASIFQKQKLNRNKDSVCSPQLDLSGLLHDSLWRLFFCKNKHPEATKQDEKRKKKTGYKKPQPRPKLTKCGVMSLTTVVL